MAHYVSAWILILIAATIDRLSTPNDLTAYLITITAISGFGMTLGFGIQRSISLRSAYPVLLASVLVAFGVATVLRIWPPSSWSGVMGALIGITSFKGGEWIVRRVRDRRTRRTRSASDE